MGGLFKKPEVPKVPKTKPMPDENDPLITLARRRRLATEMQTGGNVHEVDATWLTAMRAKHAKWLAKEAKREAAVAEVANIAAE